MNIPAEAVEAAVDAYIGVVDRYVREQWALLQLNPTGRPLIHKGRKP